MSSQHIFEFKHFATNIALEWSLSFCIACAWLLESECKKNLLLDCLDPNRIARELTHLDPEQFPVWFRSRHRSVVPPALPVNLSQQHFWFVLSLHLLSARRAWLPLLLSPLAPTPARHSSSSWHGAFLAFLQMTFYLDLLFFSFFCQALQFNFVGFHLFHQHVSNSQVIDTVASKHIFLNNETLLFYIQHNPSVKKLTSKNFSLKRVDYFQNGLKPFSCYVKVSYATKVIDWR